MTRRIVLAGGNGFIGRLLVKSFVAGNYEVVILTGSPVAGETAIRQVRWDERTLGDWAGELEGADALINLAGRSVNCRYNARNRREILSLEWTRHVYWARQSLAVTRLRRSGLMLAPPLSTNTHSTGRWMRPPVKLARPRKPRMNSPSKLHAPGKKRSTRRPSLLRGRSRCARQWSSPRAKVASTGPCEGSRDGGWEAPLLAGASSFLGFTKPIFATRSNG